MKPNKLSRTRVMKRSLAVNVSLIAAKFIGGFLARSAAMVADGVHSLTDTLSDILVIVGLRQSRKPPDKEHPIGHGKVEYVLSLFLGMGVLFIAYELLISVVAGFGGTPEAPSFYGVFVIGAVIVSKFILARYILSQANILDSQVLHASGQESFTDMLGSCVVLVGIVLATIGDRYGIGFLLYADAFAAIFIVIFIVKVAVSILSSSVRSILGKSASKEVLQSTKDIIEEVDGVRTVDRLTMIVYGHYYQLMVDIRVDGDLSVKEGHDIAHDVRNRLEKIDRIKHIIVHVNPEVEE